MAAVKLPCQYAALAERVALIRTGTPAPVPSPLACEIAATHRVRVVEHGVGLASWTVAEVCVMCAHMARDLPGYEGQPMPIDPFLPQREAIPADLLAAVRAALST